MYKVNYTVFFAGTMPEEGVPDMTSLTVLDEAIINKNLKVRYQRDNIYVSFCQSMAIN